MRFVHNTFLLLALAVTGCVTTPRNLTAEQREAVKFYDSAAVPLRDAFRDNKSRDVHFFSDELMRDADFVLEAEAVDRFKRLRPDPTGSTVRGHDGYLGLIPKGEQSGRKLAILIIPESESVESTKRILDDVILDVHEALRARGFERVLVGARFYSVVVQIYSQGLPSRQQVAARKQLWQQTTDDIYEAVFRWQFRHNAAGWKAKACYLSVERGDPSDDFIKRFANHSPKVFKASAAKTDANYGVRDKRTGERGLKFQVERIRWKTATMEVEVSGGYYDHGLSSSDNRYTVEKIRGKWKVISDIMIGVS